MLYEAVCVYVTVQCETADIGAEYGDVRPLDEDRIHQLSINAGQVLDRVVADVAFVTELATAGVSRGHRENILSTLYSHVTATKS